MDELEKYLNPTAGLQTNPNIPAPYSPQAKINKVYSAKPSSIGGEVIKNNKKNIPTKQAEITSQLDIPKFTTPTIAKPKAPSTKINIVEGIGGVGKNQFNSQSPTSFLTPILQKEIDKQKSLMDNKLSPLDALTKSLSGANSTGVPFKPSTNRQDRLDYNSYLYGRDFSSDVEDKDKDTIRNVLKQKNPDITNLDFWTKPFDVINGVMKGVNTVKDLAKKELSPYSSIINPLISYLKTSPSTHNSFGALLGAKDIISSLATGKGVNNSTTNLRSLFTDLVGGEVDNSHIDSVVNNPKVKEGNVGYMELITNAISDIKNQDFAGNSAKVTETFVQPWIDMYKSNYDMYNKANAILDERVSRGEKVSTFDKLLANSYFGADYINSQEEQKNIKASERASGVAIVGKKAAETGLSVFMNTIGALGQATFKTGVNILDAASYSGSGASEYLDDINKFRQGKVEDVYKKIGFNDGNSKVLSSITNTLVDFVAAHYGSKMAGKMKGTTVGEITPESIMKANKSMSLSDAIKQIDDGVKSGVIKRIDQGKGYKYLIDKPSILGTFGKYAVEGGIQNAPNLVAALYQMGDDKVKKELREKFNPVGLIGTTSLGVIPLPGHKGGLENISKYRESANILHGISEGHKEGVINKFSPENTQLKADAIENLISGGYVVKNGTVDEAGNIGYSLTDKAIKDNIVSKDVGEYLQKEGIAHLPPEQANIVDAKINIENQKKSVSETPSPIVDKSIDEFEALASKDNQVASEDDLISSMESKIAKVEEIKKEITPEQTRLYNKAKTKGFVYDPEKNSIQNWISYKYHSISSQLFDNTFQVLGRNILGKYGKGTLWGDALNATYASTKEKSDLSLNELQNIFKNFGKEDINQYSKYAFFKSRLNQIDSRIANIGEGKTSKDILKTGEFTEDEMRAYVNKFDSVYTNTQTRMNNLRAKFMNEMSDSGYISKKEADELMKTNPDYVPSSNLLAALDSNDPTKIRNGLIKELKEGSDDFTPDLNVIELLNKKFAKGYGISVKNRILTDINSAGGAIDIGYLKSIRDGVIKDIDISQIEKIKRNLDIFGIKGDISNVENIKANLYKIESQLKNKNFEANSFYRDGESSDLWIPGYVSKKINGARYELNTSITSKVARYVGGWNKILRTSGVNVPFQLIKAPFREIGQTFPNVYISTGFKGSMEYIGSAINNVAQSLGNMVGLNLETGVGLTGTKEGKAAMFKLYQSLGGTFGTAGSVSKEELRYYLGDSQDLVKETSFWNKFKKTGREFVEGKYGHNIELNTTRIPAFSAMLKKSGVTADVWQNLAEKHGFKGFDFGDTLGLQKDLEAMGVDVKDSAAFAKGMFDYSALGSTMRELNQYTSYLGIPLQGLQSEFKNKIVRGLQSPENAARLGVVLGTYITGAYSIWNYWNKDDNGKEEWNNLPSYIKSRMVIPIKGSDGKFSYVPMPGASPLSEAIYGTAMNVLDNLHNNFEASGENGRKRMAEVFDNFTGYTNLSTGFDNSGKFTLSADKVVDPTKLPDVIRYGLLWMFGKKLDKFGLRDITYNENKTNPLANQGKADEELVNILNKVAEITGGTKSEIGTINGGLQISPDKLQSFLDMVGYKGSIKDSTYYFLDKILKSQDKVDQIASTTSNKTNYTARVFDSIAQMGGFKYDIPEKSKDLTESIQISQDKKNIQEDKGYAKTIIEKELSKLYSGSNTGEDFDSAVADYKYKALKDNNISGSDIDSIVDKLKKGGELSLSAPDFFKYKVKDNLGSFNGDEESYGKEFEKAKELIKGEKFSDNQLNSLMGEFNGYMGSNLVDSNKNKLDKIETPSKLADKVISLYPFGKDYDSEDMFRGYSDSVKKYAAKRFNKETYNEFINLLEDKLNSIANEEE